MTVAGLSLQGLVDRLRTLDEASVSLGSVSELLSATRPGRALASFVHFDASKYTRHQVHRCGLFDVIVLCWSPGQVTPVHNHSGQRGWVRVLRGSLEEVTYAPTGRSAVASEGLDAADACLLAARVGLEETGRGIVPASDAVVTVDRERAVHRLGNPSKGAAGERAVSLHVYSLPHDSCLVYDLETQSVARRELSFDTSAPSV